MKCFTKPWILFLQSIFILQEPRRKCLEKGRTGKTDADWLNYLSHSRPAHQVTTSGCRVVWRVTRAGHRLLFNPTTGRLEQRKSSLLLTTSARKILISPILFHTDIWTEAPADFFQIHLFNCLSYDRIYDTPPQAVFFFTYS